MKIKRIELYNFGSYEDLNTFDLSSDDPDKRIIVIGGKNGSGKTTFFTAIQVCLYGNYAFGYKNAGKVYLKEVYNLINNSARLKKDEIAYIKIIFQHTEARDRTEYEILRRWSWPDGEIKEDLNVRQNGIEMEEDEINSFQNYLIHLIPPDLLKLYFFDGEKIADYFLSDNKINIREALMILSGNDTFDILYNNVRRVLNINKDCDDDIANQYFSAQNNYHTAEMNLEDAQNNRDKLSEELVNVESELEQLRKQYVAKGGLTLDELNKLQSDLKLEEEKRESINSQRKTFATDILPFIILGDWVDKIKPQIEQEEEYDTFQTLSTRLTGESFYEVLKIALNKVGVESKETISSVQEDISESLLPEDWSNFEPLFLLSSDDKIQVYAVLNRVFDCDPDSLKKYQTNLEKSLNRSKEIRATIQRSDVEHIEEYIRETTKLEGQIKLIETKIEQCDSEIERDTEIVHAQEKALTSARKAFENELKKESVSALSGRVLLLLEDLQKNVYSLLIKKVESDLKLKLSQLMRKQDFFDDIKIDFNFNVHIIRNQTVQVNDLIQVVRQGGQSALRRSIGDIAVDQLMDGEPKMTNNSLIKLLKNIPSDDINLPLEIDKDHMSSGEKQIFVMSLYWALMQQSDNDLPYVIDTPFARIDTEHRENITEHFFLDLNGQLFILSTNEELGDEHLKAMDNQIAHVYTLEYGEDKKTTIYQNHYFEV